MNEENQRVRIPQQQRSRSTKDRILDAGQRLFCLKGLHGTNSKEIAVEAGVAIGSFYAYFKDKKDLFISVLNRYTDRIFADIPDLPLQSLTRENASDLIYKYVRRVVRAHDLPELHRQLFVVMQNDPQLQRLIESWQQESVRRIEASLQTASEHLRVRDIKTAAVLLHATLEAVIQRLTLHRVDVEERQLVKELADMFCRYLLNGGK